MFKKIASLISTMSLLGLYLVPSSVVAIPAPRVDYNEINITNDTTYLQSAPDIEANYVVYSQRPAEGKGYIGDVKLYNLATGQFHTISQTLGNSGEPKLNSTGTAILYVDFSYADADYGDLILADISNLSSITYTRLTSTGKYDLVDPDQNRSKISYEIHGNKIAWVERNCVTDAQEVFVADITDPQNPVVSQVTTPDGTYKFGVKIYGNDIVWSNTDPSTSDIEAYYADTSDMDNIVPVNLTNDPAKSQTDVIVTSTGVYWAELTVGGIEVTADIYYKPFAGSPSVLTAGVYCSGEICVGNPVASGSDLYAWSDGINVFVHTTGTGLTLPITAYTGGSGSITDLAYSGGKYAWSRTTGSGSDIFVTSAASPAPVYRFWSDQYRGHFYTMSATERDNIIANMPEWSYEGEVYQSFGNFSSLRKPIYRFWSSQYRHHFYTSSESEKNNIIANMPEWSYEGIAYYAFETYVQGTFPLYRFWSSQYRGHFYTSSESEKNNILGNMPEWSFEGVGYYIPVELN